MLSKNLELGNMSSGLHDIKSGEQLLLPKMGSRHCRGTDAKSNTVYCFSVDNLPNLDL